MRIFGSKLSFKRSDLLTTKIALFFKKAGYNVTLRLNKKADDDFIFTCQSRFFVPSGGGFSILMKELVLKRGGQVFAVED